MDANLPRITKIVTSVPLVLMFSSCASLFNGPTTKIEIQTRTPGRIIHGKDTLYTRHSRRVILRPVRSADPLIINVLDDKGEAEVKIPAVNSIAYVLNLPCNAGLGMLVDKDKPKRYGYPGKVQASTSRAPLTLRNRNDHTKNDLDLHVSIPYINNFLLRPANRPGEREKSSTGFLGIGLGLDYYLAPNRSLGLHAAAVTDFELPLPIPYELVGEYEIFSSLFFSLIHSHKVNRFNLGYGLSYTLNTWDRRYFERSGAPPPTRPPIKRQNQALGFIFPLYFQFGQYFNAGLTYRPTLYRLDTTPTFEYEHLISLELIGKVKLR